MVLALTGARILRNDDLVEGMAVLIEDSRITAVVPENAVPRGAQTRVLSGGILAPGFIDTQVNGGGGILFNETPDVEALRIMGAAHRRFGTTAFLPTVISDDTTVIDRAMRAVEQAIAEGVPGVIGIHVEGPMLAPSRSGIHDSRFFQGANQELLDLLCSLRAGRTLVTVAPEIVGPEWIAKLVEAGVIVAAGHTEATYDEMQAGFTAGISGVTHLFNAMSAMANRAPGAVGAALEDRNAWCGLIVDGVHVHPATLRIALRCRPLDRFMLVTDAMPPVGTDATFFDLQGRRIEVAADRCIDEHGTLAGSNLTMAAAVRNSVGLLGLSPASALKLASATPAAFLGITQTRGIITAGSAADLVWLDDGLNVKATWIGASESEEAELC